MGTLLCRHATGDSDDACSSAGSSERSAVASTAAAGGDGSGRGAPGPSRHAGWHAAQHGNAPPHGWISQHPQRHAPNAPAAARPAQPDDAPWHDAASGTTACVLYCSDSLLMTICRIAQQRMTAVRELARKYSQSCLPDGSNNASLPHAYGICCARRGKHLNILELTRQLWPPCRCRQPGCPTCRASWPPRMVPAPARLPRDCTRLTRIAAKAPTGAVAAEPARVHRLVASNVAGRAGKSGALMLAVKCT